MHKISIKTPADILATVPVVLGFVPTDSTVMLTFGAERTFHARVDLAHTPADARETAPMLLDPCTRHGVKQVLFVYYGNVHDACIQHDAMVKAFDATLIQVMAAVVVTETGFGLVDDARMGRELSPLPTATSAITAQAVADGRSTTGTRTDLVARVARTTVIDLDGEDPTCAGSLILACNDDTEREDMLNALTRTNALAYVTTLTDAIRVAPDTHVDHVAAMLAMAAWMNGDGALAWCAIDRALNPTSLAMLVKAALEGAVPPPETFKS